MGISTVVATLARTPQQAGGLNAIVALSLAAIGGVFIPLSQAPEGLVAISQITPHYWFLRGIDSLASPSAGLADIAPSVAVLLGDGRGPRHDRAGARPPGAGPMTRKVAR